MDRRTMLATVAAGLAAAGQAQGRDKTRVPSTISGGFSVYTNGERIGVTSQSSPMGYVGALLHLENFHVTCAFRTTSFWVGTAENPYQNNDCYLSEVFNNTQSNSLNRSWAGSFCNAYNKIPAGVTDSGTRVGIIGWATSVFHSDKGYKHEGTLAEQIGVQGAAGFQSAGSGASAVIQKAVGVYGVIYSGSEGATIGDARAGEFKSVAQVGNIQSNMAVYAEAVGGLSANYSFYGKAGEFFNAAKALFGSLCSQAKTSIAARTAGNSIEFGHEDPGGYASTIGATYSAGLPFVAFCAEADATGNTFTTRGKAGSVMYGDLAGGFVFGRLPNTNASGQGIVESVGINHRGNLRLSKNPPSSSGAPGQTGEMAWDDNYVYICVAPNTWKRSALGSW